MKQIITRKKAKLMSLNLQPNMTFQELI